MATKSSSGTSYNDVIDQLKNKSYRPIYFLTGDEPYYIDKISDYIEKNVLDEGEKSFNQSIFYGKDISVRDVINAARRFPMMASHQVIIVKEAQNIKDLNELEVYVKNPQTSTILVICNKPKTEKTGKGTRLTALINEIKKQGVYFESNKLYDNKIPAWIQSFIESEGLRIDPSAAQLLVEYLGNDLSKIAHEIQKLKVTLPPDTKLITTTNIEQNIGISKDFNRFELTKAISDRNILKCNRIVDYFAHNPNANPFVLSLTAIHQHFVRILKVHLMSKAPDSDIAREIGINPFFMSEYRQAARNYNTNKIVSILSILREYDLRSKGMNNGSTDQGELLRELIFFILH